MRYVILVLVIFASAAGHASERIALIVGNATYANEEFSLQNPENDARALAQALRPLGFDSRVVINADGERLSAELETFAERAAGAEIAFFFFAGHGVQMNGENYFLTSGFSRSDRDEIYRQSVSLGQIRGVFARMDAKLGVIVLDACRDNPLKLIESLSRGLAPSPRNLGLLIAYATDPDNVAYDGQGQNSVFTTELLKHLATPGLDVRLMFGRVRQGVVRATGGAQVPWVEEAVLGEHSLMPASDDSASALAGDVAAWQRARAEGTAEAHASYLEAYPEGLYAPIAAEYHARLSAAETPRAAPITMAYSPPDRDKVVAALSTLGLLPASRNLVQVDRETIASSLGAYASDVAPGAADIDTLALDAAQMTVLLGALTGQRIRTDMAALSAIEIALESAENARRELATLSETSMEAKAALETADADIAGIKAARKRVLERLDETRAYYGELVERGASYFRAELPRALAGLNGGRHDSSRRVEEAVLEGAARFVAHAGADGVTRAKGSIAWLTDFLS